MSEPKKKGGARKGAGRKPSGKVRRIVLIDPENWDAALASGNASALVDELLSKWRQRKGK